jgi:hypothetical protein
VELVVTVVLDPSLKVAVAVYEEVAPAFTELAPVTIRLLKLVFFDDDDEEQAAKKLMAKIHNRCFFVIWFLVFFISQSLLPPSNYVIFTSSLLNYFTGPCSFTFHLPNRIILGVAPEPAEEHRSFKVC